MRKKTLSERTAHQREGLWTAEQLIEANQSLEGRQRELFQYLAKTWPKNRYGAYECEICGDWLPFLEPINFMHVIPKGSNGYFGLRPKNIVCGCRDCHFKYDHITHKAIDDPKFGWLIKLKTQLEMQYHRLNKRNLLWQLEMRKVR